MKETFLPSQPGDDEKNRLARILNIILLFMSVGSITVALIGLLTGRSNLAIVMCISAVTAIVSLLLARRGMVPQAGFLVLILLVAILNMLLIIGTGIHDIAIMLVPVIILIAGLLLNRTGLILITGLTSLSLALIIWGEIDGILRTPYSAYTDWGDLVIVFIIIAVSTTTVRLLIEDLRASLRRAYSSEAKYKAVIENNPSIIYIQGLKEENPTLYISSQVNHLLGFSTQAFLDEPYLWVQLLHPDDKEKVLAENKRTNRSLEPFIMDYRMTAKNGQVVWVNDHAVVVRDSNGKPGFWLGIWTDITERKQMENALRLSEERYRLISEVSVDYTFSTEVNAQGEMRLTWVAGAFQSMTGYTFNEYVTAGGWRGRLHPDDRERDDGYLEILQKNQPVIGEVRTLKKDGELRWVRVYAHPVWERAGRRLAGIYGAVQDITERKQVEAEREKLICELEAKNTELEQFTYTVSHDLKSPLVTVNGFLDFLKKDVGSGNIEKSNQDISRISDAVQKMEALLNELLELSRIGRMMNPSEDVSFGGIVLEARDQVRGRLEAKKVEVEIQEGLPSVRGDRVRLVEVVQNLLDNAAKFMGSQPKPKVKVGIRGTDDGGNPVFYVQDNGIGIDPRFHERIFGLFNKLNPNIEGTGIGLALVKRIVDVHGGRVWVESDGTNGSTFLFTLPPIPKS